MVWGGLAGSSPVPPQERPGCHDSGTLGYFTNVCGQPHNLQIRTQVSTLGDRAPASSSRYSYAHAEVPCSRTDRPACFPIVLEHAGERRHQSSLGGSGDPVDAPWEAVRVAELPRYRLDFIVPEITTSLRSTGAHNHR